MIVNTLAILIKGLITVVLELHLSLKREAALIQSYVGHPSEVLYALNALCSAP